MHTTDRQPNVIVVVDDDEALRDSWCALLSREGLDVRVAGDAAQAMAAMQGGRLPELALLDLGLPPDAGTPSAGLDLLQRMLVEAPRMKIIVLTGQDEPVLSHRAINLGAFDYLIKPAGRTEVLQALQRAQMFLASERLMAAEGRARITVTAPIAEGVREFGEAAQERLVRCVIHDSGHNVAHAARRLGLTREHLYYFIRKFGIQR